MTPTNVSLLAIRQDFTAFLSTREYAVRREELKGYSCLLDIVWVWLEFGNGYRSCQSFEHLLLFVIDAADDWSKSDGSTIYNCDHSPLRQDETIFIQGLSSDRNASASERARTHPVLDRSAFVDGIARQAHRRRRFMRHQ